jgi:hypothetical protein
VRPRERSARRATYDPSDGMYPPRPISVAMIESWQQFAVRKRNSEDRLIGRYRLEAFNGDTPAEGRGYPTLDTAWGLGREFHPGLYVAGVGRGSAWPETGIVLNLFSEARPQQKIVAIKGIWPPDQWHQDQPPYNEMFWMNLAEGIETYPRRRISGQNGPVAYFVWRSTVDLANPPADGDPPLELLDARAELDRIANQ